MKKTMLTIMILLVSLSLFSQGFLSKYTGIQIETILDYSDGVTLGIAQANKALILDASGGITLIKVNLPNNTFITATKYAGGENYDLMKLNIDDNIEYGRPQEIGDITVPLAAGIKTLVNIITDGASASTEHGIVIMANDTDTLFVVVTEDDGASGIQNTVNKFRGNVKGNMDVGASDIMMVYKGTFDYLDTSTKDIIELPIGTVVWQVTINETTTFDDSDPTWTLVVSQWNPCVDRPIETTMYHANNTSPNLPYKCDVVDYVAVGYTGFGFDGTQGEADIYIHYTLP